MVAPAETRAAVARLWTCNAHLFPTSIALACTVRDFLDTQEITGDDINAIVERLLLPEVRQRHRGAWDVIADLSRFVAEAAAWNKSRRETNERRRAAEKQEAAEPPKRIDLAGMFAMPD